MKLYPKKAHGDHITGYFILIGSKEARDAGFIREDGTVREGKKTVDPDEKRIIVEPVEDE